jgi:anti-sigma regulatory factor (Ser/Thr protein kinase)
MSVLEDVDLRAEHLHLEGFRHEALFYDGGDEFLDGTVSFIREGVEAGESVLVAVAQPKIDALTAALAGDLEGVIFVDMPAIGINPARIIPIWRRFAGENADRGQGFRGIGEPAWPGRTAPELDECARHESLLNLAFDGGEPWRLLCPYDAARLPDDVLETAQRTHPVLAGNGSAGRSGAYDTEMARRALEGELPAPGGVVEELAFDADGLAGVRRLVDARAHDAGLGPERAADLRLAVNELATNSVRHGGGGGTVRFWREGDELLCEVADPGRIRDPLTGRYSPTPAQLDGRGVWLANQLCDLVRLRSSEQGAVVRLHMRA